MPEDRTQVPARIYRDADHIAHVVDAESHASDVAGKRVEVTHLAVFPEERQKLWKKEPLSDMGARQACN